jgi:putative oxidoreductase
MTIIEKFGPLLGRVLMALLFVPAGISKIAGFAGTVGYIATKGMPLPEVMAAGAIIVEAGGGLALLVGFKTRWVALALAAFTVAAGLIFHNFWAASADQQMIQSIMFFKNLAIAGGLLFVAAFGAGPLSLDRQG